MKKDAKHLGADLVINHGVSITAAAKQVGASTSSVRLAVLAHPDYEKAKLAGKLHTAPTTTPHTPEDLAKHPAVVDLIQSGAPYESVAARHGLQTTTLYRWVKKAFPDYVSPHGTGPRSASKVGQTRSRLEEQTISMLLASINAASENLGISATRLIRMVSDASRGADDVQTLDTTTPNP